MDVSANFRPSQHWVLTLGADNVFNAYPDKSTYANSTYGLIPYSLQSPFGFNGTYAYGRVTFKW
jgi:iron complex outermembrane receptor protein